MADKTWPVALRFSPRDRDLMRLEGIVASWDTYGIVLRDGAGEEHHFGFPDWSGGQRLFTFVVSYTDDGRDALAGLARDKLSERGFDIAEPSRGPTLSPVVHGAMRDLASFATRKGFAFDEERARAVQTFGALVRGNEPFDPEEIYVWGATHGYRPKDADGLREYARRAISGGGTRTVGKQPIRVDLARADRMLEAWREETKAGLT